ncbi:MAG: hypothetical protein NT004_04350 [Bacteroidetes bacterium]|nr:hypothetical protein [Bacteroidota bacterium]
MKTKMLLKKITPFVLLMALMVIVAISCKKKDDEPAPPSPPVPPSPVVPDVFVPSALHLVTDYEKTHGMRFPAYSNRLVHRGLVGEEVPEIPNPLKNLGKSLWDVYVYEHTEHQFAKIDDELDNISSQIASLTTQVNQYGNAILGELNLMTTLLSNENIKPSLEDINNFWMDFPGSWSNFMAFQNASAAYERNPQNPDSIATMQQAQSNVKTWATLQNSKTIWTDLANISGLINLSGNIGILSQFSSTLCAKAKGSIIDSAMAMNYYMILEGYFLNLLNYQSNAETMIMNIDNVLDTTGATATNDYNTKFAPKIQSEVSAFLYAVDYLVANISDYRTTDRFNSDMNYRNTGLAPDNVFINALARSQFVANMIYEGLGLPFPVMCGYVLTPLNYTNGNSPIVNDISINFSNYGNMVTKTTTATRYTSQIPYTYWTSGNPAKCGADNTWNVYRIGNVGTSDGVTWHTGKIQATISDNNNFYTPWAHTAPIQGFVQTYFYNPANPSEANTSTSATATNTFQFGWFSANWQWGYLFMSDFNQAGWQHTDNFAVYQYNSNIGVSGDINSPHILTSDKNGNLYPHGTDAMNVGFTNSTLGMLQMNGSMITTPYFYIAFDLVDFNMQAASDPANLVGADLQAWGKYNAYYNGFGSGGNDLWVNIGTGLVHTQEGESWASNGKIVSDAHYHNASGNWNEGFGKQTGMSRNTTYSPSYQYYYQTYNVGSVPLTIQLGIAYQFIYTGFFLTSK